MPVVVCYANDPPQKRCTLSNDFALKPLSFFRVFVLHLMLGIEFFANNWYLYGRRVKWTLKGI